MRLYPLVLLDWSACFTFMDILCNGVHGQVHPSVTSTSVCRVSSLVARGVMGPPSYKDFTLMLPVQSHLSHFNLSSLIHLLVVLMFHSGQTPRDLGVHVTDFYSQLLQPGSNILPQWGSPDRFASALPVVLLPLLQPPPQGIGHHPGVGVKIEHWPHLSTVNV